MATLSMADRMEIDFECMLLHSSDQLSQEEFEKIDKAKYKDVIENPTTFDEAWNHPCEFQRKVWRGAITLEHTKMSDMRVWKKIERSQMEKGRRCVKQNWVFEIKRDRVTQTTDMSTDNPFHSSGTIKALVEVDDLVSITVNKWLLQAQRRFIDGPTKCMTPFVAHIEAIYNTNEKLVSLKQFQRLVFERFAEMNRTLYGMHEYKTKGLLRWEVPGL